jgi:CubicO group peptidase (beta-lactamase class C family)
VAQLGIDDYSSLTPAERQATVRQLLQARSGVYLPTAAETPDMRAARPLRGSHPPGSFWYYNNWDFNVLGEIYQRQTGLGVFSAFEHLLARPLGFQDFNPLEHARFAYDRNSPRFPAYNLFLSTRDMARFGQLFLDGGRWNGREIVPAAWVAESTRPVSRSDRERGIMSAYGHLWWADADPTTSGLPSGSYTAWGVGGRFIAVMPPVRTVVAIQPHEVRGQPKALIDTQSGALDELLMRIAAL